MTRFLNFLGSLRAENDRITADAKTITHLRQRLSEEAAANEILTDELAKAHGEIERWKDVARLINVEGTEALKELAKAHLQIARDAPEVAYALKRKASLAAYERKRGRG